MKNLVSITTNIFLAVLVMMTLSFSGITLARDVKEAEPENIEYVTLIADDGTEFILKKYWKIYRDSPAPSFFNSVVFDFTLYIGEIICNDISIWQYQQNVPIHEITIEKEKEYKDFTTYRVTILERPYAVFMRTNYRTGQIQKDDEYFNVSTNLLWIDKENHKYCGSFNNDHMKYCNDREYYDIFKDMHIDVLDSYIKQYKEYIAEGKYFFNINIETYFAMQCISKFDEESGEKYKEELSSISKSGFYYRLPSLI